MASNELNQSTQVPPKLKRYVVTLMHKGALRRDMAARLNRMMDSVITTPKESTAIDVIVESGGGDAHAAYKLYLDLRSRCVSLRAVVPDFAKSAATLLMLGMDKIFMAPSAELGPLDVQVEHPHREGEIVSGLDIANSLDFLAETALQIVLRGGGAIRSITGLPRAEAIRDMTNFAARFMEPMVAKLDPHLLHQSYNSLNVARHYAERMLDTRNLADNSDQLEQGARDALIHKLINEYSAHAFVIGPDEAKKLGLPICSAAEHPMWGFYRLLHRNFDADNSRGELLTVISENNLSGTVSGPGAASSSGRVADEGKGDSNEEAHGGVQASALAVGVLHAAAEAKGN